MWRGCEDGGKTLLISSFFSSTHFISLFFSIQPDWFLDTFERFILTSLILCMSLSSMRNFQIICGFSCTIYFWPIKNEWNMVKLVCYSPFRYSHSTEIATIEYIHFNRFDFVSFYEWISYMWMCVSAAAEEIFILEKNSSC